jgi:hypothetical protein
VNRHISRDGGHTCSCGEVWPYGLRSYTKEPHHAHDIHFELAMANDPRMLAAMDFYDETQWRRAIAIHLHDAPSHRRRSQRKRDG